MKIQLSHTFPALPASLVSLSTALPSAPFIHFHSSSLSVFFNSRSSPMGLLGIGKNVHKHNRRTRQALMLFTGGKKGKKEVGENHNSVIATLIVKKSES